MITISLTRILTDGLLLSLALSVLIFISLYLNPRVWLQDYPKEIQAKVPPKTDHEKRVTWVVGLLFLGLIISTLIYSVSQVKVENGGSISFVNAFLHVFLVFNIFNLVDAVIIDYLILTLMKPKFIVIPGAEGMEYLYNDWKLHVGNYLKGIVFCTFFALPIGFIISIS